MCRNLSALVILSVSVSLVPALHADVIFSWCSTDGGETLSGNATFSVQKDGSTYELVIVVNNTAPAGSSFSSDLTGLYFDIGGVSESALSMISGVATDGFVQSNGGQGSNNGGWESGFWSSGYNADNYGIGTSGRNGAYGWNDYGSPGDYYYLDKSATFVLAGLTSSQISISDVTAEYTAPGASFYTSQTAQATETNAAPEPATFFEFFAAVIVLGFAYRRRLARSRSGAPGPL